MPKSFLNPIKEYADELKMPFSFNVRGGMFGFFFSNSLPKNFDDVQKTDIELFAKFLEKCLRKIFICHHLPMKVVSYQLFMMKLR